jgi:hypothetical protein
MTKTNNKGKTMEGLIKQKHGGALKPLKKGETANPNGRPRKYICLLKEQGYKLSEINDTIQAMMSMDEKELKAVLGNDSATIMEKTIAKAMMKSYKNGSLYSMDTLLTRVFGKPKEQVDIQSDNKIEVIFVDGKTIL